MNKLDLDLGAGSMNYDVIDVNDSFENNYQKAINYAKRRGVSEEKVFEIMSSAGGVEQDASDACEEVYESQGSEAFNKCRQEYISKISEQDKGKFWNKFLTGVGNVADSIKGYGADQKGTGFYEKGNTQNTNPNYTIPDTETRILGMKPLVFSLVALTVVITGGIAIAMIGSKKITK